MTTTVEQYEQFKCAHCEELYEDDELRLIEWEDVEIELCKQCVGDCPECGRHCPMSVFEEREGMCPDCYDDYKAWQARMKRKGYRFGEPEEREG